MARISAQMMQVKSFKPTYHSDELEIILVLKGVLKLYKVERVTELHVGEFSFVNRNNVHYVESDDATIISFKIHLASFKHVFERIEYVEFTNYTEYNVKEKILRDKLNAILLDLLISEYTLLQDGEKTEELVFVEDQLLQLLFSSYQLANHIKDEEDYVNNDLVSRYYYVVEYVFNHIGEKISVDDIVNKLYMNPAYFSQFMKKIGGVGFKEFVLYRKLGYIVALLLDKNLSVDEIAVKSGITDTKSFYALFKKYFNNSPSKWRKSIMNIVDDYCLCNDMVLLKEFIDTHKIDKHKENTISRYIKFLTNEKDKSYFSGNTLVINPYKDIAEGYEEEYQPYKYLYSLIKIVEEYEMDLTWVFPCTYLRSGHSSKLYLDFLTSSLFNVGYSRVRKWNIAIMIDSHEDFEIAKYIKKETENIVNGINIEIMLKI